MDNLLKNMFVKMPDSAPTPINMLVPPAISRTYFLFCSSMTCNENLKTFSEDIYFLRFVDIFK